MDLSIVQRTETLIII